MQRRVYFRTETGGFKRGFVLFSVFSVILAPPLCDVPLLWAGGACRLCEVPCKVSEPGTQVMPSGGERRARMPPSGRAMSMDTCLY